MPTDEKDSAGLVPVNRGQRQFSREPHQLVAAFRGHLLVHLRIPRRMPPRIVLESGDDGIFPPVDPCTGRRVPGDLIKRIRLEVGRAGREIKLRLDPVTIEVGLGKSLDPAAERLVAQDDHRA